MGQKYDPHCDWDSNGVAHDRVLTLLLYLTDQQDPAAGGETAFPMAGDGVGIAIAPKKGQAVLFYNLLEDGNGDEVG